MSTTNPTSERHILLVSIIGGTTISVFAIIWGIAINAQLIIFDGVVSLISIVLAGVSLVTVEYIKQPDDRLFQFGRSQLQPLVAVVQASMIIIMSLYALFTAVSSLLSGGRPVAAGLGVIYAVIAGLASFGVWYYISHKSRHLKSSLIESERQQWIIDSLLTVVVLISFLIAMAMNALGWTDQTRYVDPIIVILAVIYFLGMPLRLLISNFREILLMAPDKELQNRVEQTIQAICAAYAFEKSVIRMTKVGPDLPIQVGIVTAHDHPVVSIQALDQIREEIYTRLSDIEYNLWLTVIFTTDEKWA